VTKLILEYFWVICIGMTAINLYVYRPRIAAPGADEAGDSREIQAARHRVFVAMIVPWLVMGFAQLVGGVPNAWNFFRARELDPYVWSWYASVFLMACLFSYWVLARGGAREVVALGLFQVPEKWVKVAALVAPVFVVAWIGLVWAMDIPALR